MVIFYIVLKVSALIAITVLPLAGPKKKKTAVVKAVGNLSVNENGYLEHFAGSSVDHHPVH